MSDAIAILLCLLCLLNGAAIGYYFGQRRAGTKENVVSSPEDTLSVEELEKIRKEREELKAEQEAFLSMMGYNADIAYGLNENPFKES